MTKKGGELELLSVLVDDEASDLEVRQIFGELEADQLLREKWSRYQLVSEVLRTGRVSLPGLDISEKVNDTLEQTTKTALHPVWSVAIAASVTIAVVLAGQQFLMPPPIADAHKLVSDLGGEVVPISGAEPVLAKFDKNLGSILNAPELTSPKTSDVYKDLTRIRLKRFGSQHAAVAALTSPTPFIAVARTHQSPGENEASN